MIDMEIPYMNASGKSSLHSILAPFKRRDTSSATTGRRPQAFRQNPAQGLDFAPVPRQRVQSWAAANP
jgi:hypothetical protein